MIFTIYTRSVKIIVNSLFVGFTRLVADQPWELCEAARFYTWDYGNKILMLGLSPSGRKVDAWWEEIAINCQVVYRYLQADPYSYDVGT